MRFAMAFTLGVALACQSPGLLRAQPRNRPDAVQDLLGLVQRGEAREALRRCKDMESSRPTIGAEVNFLIVCGTANEEAGKLDEAKDYYVRAQALSPRDPNVLISLGDVGVGLFKSTEDRPRRGGIDAYCELRKAIATYEKYLEVSEKAAEQAGQRAEIGAKLTGLRQELYDFGKFLQENPTRSDVEQFLADGGRDPLACCSGCKQVGSSALSILIRFDHGSASLRPAALPQIQALADGLRAQPDKKVRLLGFASTRGGTPESNLVLSKSRADAVRNELSKVDAGLGKRIVTKGLGATKIMKAPDGTEDEEQSRRVELEIVPQ